MQERGYPASAGFLFLALLCVCAYQSAQNQHRGRNTQWAGTQMPAHFNRSVEGASAHSHATGGDMSMMPMYFVNTCHTTLWFKGWVTHDPLSYSFSLCFLVALAFGHEALASQRSLFLTKLSRESRPRRLGPREKMWLALLYGLNMASSYLLMLAVMTYNVGICLAVVIGLGLGYYMMTDMVLGGGLDSGSSNTQHSLLGLGRSDACCDLNRNLDSKLDQT